MALPHEHPFALSKKSTRLHRDTFFFPEADGGLLLGGLNQAATKASPKDINKWFHKMFPKMLPYKLDEITPQRTPFFFKYDIILKHKSIEWSETTPLKPGYYALTNMGRALTTSPWSSVGHIRPCDTFAQQLDELKLPDSLFGPGNTHKKCRKLNIRTTDLKNSVFSRDNYRCLISDCGGKPEDVVVSWIVPPGFIDMAVIKSYKRKKDVRIQENCLTLLKPLRRPFLDNAFGIDVDNGFRIVMFDDLGEKAMRLFEGKELKASTLEKVINSGIQHAPKKEFLREHFINCLRSHFLGGDIQEEYKTSDSLRLLWKKGRVTPENHPFWTTEEGREVREVRAMWTDEAELRFMDETYGNMPSERDSDSESNDEDNGDEDSDDEDSDDEDSDDGYSDDGHSSDEGIEEDIDVDSDIVYSTDEGSDEEEAGDDAERGKGAQAGVAVE